MSRLYDSVSSGSSPGNKVVYRKQEYDSGFSDTFTSMHSSSGAYTSTSSNSIIFPPTPPNLILVDVENGDSGITMEDPTLETDRLSTATKATTQRHGSSSSSGASLSPPPTLAQPTRMQVEEEGVAPNKITSRGSARPRSPVLFASSGAKRPHLPPRLPGSRRSSNQCHSSPSLLAGHGSSSGGSGTVSGRTVSPPTQQWSGRRSASPKYTSEKENQGPTSMPGIRSSSPLTCNNFQSLNLDRVPQTIDIYQLREYLPLFLQDREGDTGFHLAVIHNHPDLLDKLLFIMSKDVSLKPALDDQNCLRQTALHLAAHLQQVENMRKLLIAGASVNVTDHKGNTPLHVAAKASSPKPLEEILKYVSVATLLEVSQIRNKEGLSCVHVAAKNGNMEILEKLHGLGVDIDMQDFNSGKTALHLACENNSLANVQFLLETCEAEVDSLTYSGCSPLHVAAGRGDVSVVAYLVSMGADPELCTDEGDTALELASSEEVTSFLTKVARHLNWVAY